MELELNPQGEKPILYMTIGAPCSGKSTWAKKLVKSNGAIRVNRDDLRVMMKCKGKLGNKLEECNLSVATYAVDTLLNSGYNVVLDNTHVNIKYLDNAKKRWDSEAYILPVHFNTPLWKLHLRNIIRCIKTRVWIPRHVINSMYQNHQKLKIEMDKRLCRSISGS